MVFKPPRQVLILLSRGLSETFANRRRSRQGPIEMIVLTRLNGQNFVVNAGTLIINGDQLANKNDVITIGLTPKGRLAVTLNGETATFDMGAINNIFVNTLTGTNVVTSISMPTKMPSIATVNGSQWRTAGGTFARISFGAIVSSR